MDHRSTGALAQPTRARLFALLGELERPAATSELAQRLGLHANGVRKHMERLTEAGLVERTRSRRRRGRWLARAIPARKKRLRDVEEAGRAIGRELAPEQGEPPHAALAGVLATLGFQPSVWDKTGKLACTLGNCPYRDAVKENREVVCTLHRGLTRGLLDAIAPNAELTSFVPHDPDRAGCLIEVTGLPRRAARP
jgi:predicted ArsR family transcriptional regulator